MCSFGNLAMWLTGFNRASTRLHMLSGNYLITKPVNDGLLKLSNTLSGLSLGRAISCTAPALTSYRQHGEPQTWLKYNSILYPPRAPGEPPRPAEVVHQRSNIKYSTKKLWYIACMIRGMSVDEALKQLSFMQRKGSAIVKEVIEEAQEMAVRDHNVEFKSNLWIEDSFVRKAHTVKGFRKHAKGRHGIIHWRYSHYFVRLREGRPPKHYYPPRPTGNQMLGDYLQRLRERRILFGL